jgi:hypothetical protein
LRQLLANELIPPREFPICGKCSLDEIGLSMYWRMAKLLAASSK